MDDREPRAEPGRGSKTGTEPSESTTATSRGSKTGTEPSESTTATSHGSKTGTEPSESTTATSRGSKTGTEPSESTTAESRGSKTGAKPSRATHRVRLLSGTQIQVSGPRALRIATIASEQRGRVSRRQLLTAGLTDNVIAALVRRHLLFRLYPGVYAVGHLARLPLGDESAALLAVPGTAALSHTSAGAVWKMLPLGPGDDRIHVMVGHARPRPMPGVCLHRSRRLTSADIRVHDGVPVMSPAHVLLDLTEVLSERDCELAYDRALVARIMTPVEVERVLDEADGRAGKRLLRKLHKRQSGPTVTRSEAEERFLALIRRAQLPEPLVNARVHGYEVDFLWPGSLIVEIDGFRFHSTRHAFEHDHRKDTVLRGVGLPVLRFTWHQIIEEPAAVVALVARALPL